jgi:uncharacterized C2H2 Zn-finger protein/uncharacterized protein YhhL (DUF1145 family)
LGNKLKWSRKVQNLKSIKLRDRFGEDKEMPYCPKCGILFLSEDKLRKHVANAHGISKSQEPSLLRFDGEYLGGHTVYPSRCQISLSVDENEVFVHTLNMHIPYSAIKEVKDLDEGHLDALRVFIFGVSALSRKKEKYLCLIYNDEIQEQNPVFKLDNLEEVQTLVHQQVVKARQLQK